HQHLRLRTACEFEMADLNVTLDGQSKNLGGGDGKWPSSTDIQTAFTAARDTCFPRQTEADEWAQRRVVVVTYAVDVVGQEELPEGLTSQDFNLDGFTDRAE